MPECITTAARGACRSMPPTPPTGSTCRPATARPGATTATRVPSPPACATNGEPAMITVGLSTLGFCSLGMLAAMFSALAFYAASPHCRWPRLRRAGRLGHQIGLVAFGLIVSVPIIIWGSTLVLKLIDKYPLVVTFGAALLGWIAGGMLITDVIVERQFGVQPTTVKIAAEIIGALLVVVLGRWLASRKTASKESHESA
ncbi:hypothetical protein G6F32_014940 [Rhizopus arrhizus]|nr:hypothetical protein G6F32_014940 [Rhizopus arrhizus]